MTDRDLLERAAKAAGIKLTWPVMRNWTDSSPMLESSLSQTGPIWWNPLTDDGDALRLAVKLRLDIFNYGPPVHDEDHVEVVAMDGRSLGYDSQNLGSDPYAATRRAIVRAAAAMAKGE